MSSPQSKKVWLAWSSGKDAAWALHLLRRHPQVEVTGLLTTITDRYGRVSMHGVREVLLEAQAEAAGLPLYKVYIPSPCPNETYEAAFERILALARSRGVSGVAFGDILLRDVREYRERQLARVGMEALFPLWGEDSRELALRMCRAGLRAWLTCLDPRKMPRHLIRAGFDEGFVAALPEGVDPCGENGEFHTFAYEGPMFARPVLVCPGEVVEREGFLFRDLLPAGAAGAAGGDRRGPTSRKAS